MTTVPGYEVERALGQGGAGRVVAARRLATGERVALKLLPASTDEDAPDRFAREVEALRALDHPGLARLVDAGVAPDGRRWLAMALVEGTPLSELLALGVLGPGTLGGLLAKVARALAAAHARGVVHRDVKPANVIVDAHLEPVLVDFGLAALDDRKGELTGTGVAVGTPEYMAPEVLERGARAAGPPCDVWALGVILLEGLAGEHPFAREALGATIDEVLRATAPVPPPAAPPALAAACEAALRRDPAARPSAGELARLLDPAATAVEPVVSPTSETAPVAPPAPAPRRPPMPVHAGPYAFVRPLGSGTYGAVRVARHPQLLALRAVKLVEVDRPDAAERFLREGRHLARIPPHPGVVAVHDLGEAGRGWLYLAMDLVEGPTLKEVMRRGPLAPAEVARLGAALARALAHVHAQGLVHRDVKPANIVMREGRAPVLVDFGLALDTAEDRLTRSGIALGTPLYMAPEQLRAGARPGPAADVFALGALLFEALAGAHPFAADGVGAVLTAVVRREPPPLPGAPPALDRALRRALHKDPRERPDAATLAAWLEGADVPRPRRARVALAALGAAGLVVAAVALTRPARPAHVPPAEAAAIALEVEAAARRVRAARRRAVFGLPPTAPIDDDLRAASAVLGARPACCDGCPGGRALRAARDALTAASATTALTPDDAAVLLARDLAPTKPLEALRAVAGLEAADAGDPAVEAAAQVRRDASARVAASLLDPAARAAAEDQLRSARPLDPARWVDVGRAVLAAGAADEAADDERVTALTVVGRVAGARGLPPEAAALLARVGRARYAAGDLDAAAGPLSLAHALEPTGTTLPADAALTLVRRAREHLAAGRLGPATRLLEAIVRCGLPLDVNERDLARLAVAGELAVSTSRPGEPAEAALLRAAAALDGRMLGQVGDERARAAVERLDALVEAPELAPGARAEAALRALTGRCLLDPIDGAAKAEALLARGLPWLAPWRVCQAVAARLGAAGLLDPALAWARRADAALAPAALRDERADVELQLVSLLVHTGALDEARARLDDPARADVLEAAALLLRAELELRAGDLPAARAALDAFVQRRPHDPAGRRLHEQLQALERRE